MNTYNPATWPPATSLTVLAGLLLALLTLYLIGRALPRARDRKTPTKRERQPYRRTPNNRELADPIGGE